jgi:ABC-type multidrug transport system permease subunit
MYLLPVFLMILLLLLAFTYLPYEMSRDRRAIDRLRLASSIDAALATKITFFTVLAAVTVVTTYVVAGVFGHDLQPPTPSLFGIYLLTFLYAAAISLSITLLTDFSILGRVINVAVFFLVVALSNLVYPAGFFSSWGLDMARSMPTHYSMIIARSHMLKGSDPGTFLSWWGALVGFALVTLLVLKLSVEWYERGQ